MYITTFKGVKQQTKGIDIMNVDIVELERQLEELKSQANILELALLAPEEEVTFEGRAALRSVAAGITRMVGNLSASMLSGVDIEQLALTVKAEYRFMIDQHRSEMSPRSFARFLNRMHHLCPEFFDFPKKGHLTP